MDLVLAGVRPLSFFASREKHRVGELLRACRAQAACRHVGHVFVRKGFGRPETFVAVTYPGTWVINYGLRSYFSIDPVVNHADITNRPIILNDMVVDNRAVRDMLADARRFGIGRSFVSFSIAPASDCPGSLMFAFDTEPEDFAGFFERERRHLQHLAEQVHFDILAARGLAPPAGKAFELTAVEKSCLAALANGSSFDDIAIRYDLSETSVEALIEGILDKLDCGNAMHAVSKGLSLGLIEDGEPMTLDASAPIRAVSPTRH